MKIRSIFAALAWGFIIGGLLAVVLDIAEQTPRTPRQLAGQLRVEQVRIIPSVPRQEVSAAPSLPVAPPSKEPPAKEQPETSAPNGSLDFAPLNVDQAKKVALLPGRDINKSVPSLNRQTENFNVLFVGVEGKQLRMVSVYSINRGNGYNSGAVFFPVNSYFQEKTLAQLYLDKGVDGIERLLEKEMEVDIAYYVKMDRRILSEVESFLKPIVINGEPVDIDSLFTMEVTPYDEEIMGELMRQLTRPSVYFFRLPQLMLAFGRYMDTDFRLSVQNLKFHFELATSVDTQRINKVIAGGNNEYINGQKVWVVPESVLKNVVYQMTI